jgi:hypothetical protein
MKFSKKFNNSKQTIKKMVKEDYRYLQKKITGSSVYKGKDSNYKRIPKHRNRNLSYR